MSRYYFFGSLLPPLELGKKPDLPFHEFLSIAKDELSKEDLDQLAVVRRFMDIQNLRAFWQEKFLDVHGNFNALGLEEALLVEEGLPYYVFEFLRDYPSLEQRLEHFPELVSKFFIEEIEEATGYLKHYLIFERELRLVLVGFRAKLSNRDVAFELRYEDPSDVLVAQIIAQKDSEQYEPPAGYEALKEVFQTFAEDPLALYEAVSRFRMEKLNSLMDYDVFAIDHILCYMAQLIVVENWLKLNAQGGQEILDAIIRENK